MSIADDSWLGFMLLCAMRYCMGRQSYAPSVCSDFLRAHWSEIDPKTRATMRRDLHDEIVRCEEGRSFLGADFDHRGWRELLAFMDAQPLGDRDGGAR